MGVSYIIKVLHFEEPKPYIGEEAMWKTALKSTSSPLMDNIRKRWSSGGDEDFSVFYEQNTASGSPAITAPESPAALLLTQDLIGMVDYSVIRKGKT